MSYDELQAVDTSLATEVLAKVEIYGTVIPSNISLGSFVQFAADNELKEETIDGKNTTHATTMVVYQSRRVFGPELPPIVAGNHSERLESMSCKNVQHMEEDLKLVNTLVSLKKNGSRVRMAFSLKQLTQTTPGLSFV